jgi:hypothetical protein
MLDATMNWYWSTIPTEHGEDQPLDFYYEVPMKPMIQWKHSFGVLTFLKYSYLFPNFLNS